MRKKLALDRTSIGMPTCRLNLHREGYPMMRLSLGCKSSSTYVSRAVFSLKRYSTA